MTGVGGVAIAEKGHLTLWLAKSGCQVGGVQKKERNNGIFFSLSQNSKHPFHTLTYSAWQIKWGY